VEKLQPRTRALTASYGAETLSTRRKPGHQPGGQVHSFPAHKANLRECPVEHFWVDKSLDKVVPHHARHCCAII
jgi:hypothetical protein